MKPCTVGYHYGAWLVTFSDGRTLLLQGDWDQAGFAVSCGAITAPPDWDGSPSGLGDEWAEVDATEIDSCPDEYWILAEA